MAIPRLMSPKQRHAKYIHGLIIMIVLGIGLYLILPQLTGLDDSWTAIREARPWWLVVAGACLLSTYIFSALIYSVLAKQRLHFSRTLLMQVASMFAGRLLPAGIGAVGLNYLYLRRHEHHAAQAGAVVVTNNVLGFVGNVILIGGLLLSGNTEVPKYHLPHIGHWLLLTLGVLIVAIFLARDTKLLRRLVGQLREIATLVGEYRQQPGKLLGGLSCAMVVTALYTALLYACVQAIGLQLSFGAVLIVMTLGVLGATATPTPGGLGGAEAALTAGLVLYGLHTSDAVAVALLYRLFTYWLGLGLGGIALLVAERRHYI